MKRILEEKDRLKIEIETVRKIQEIGMDLFIQRLRTKRLNLQDGAGKLPAPQGDTRDLVGSGRPSSEDPAREEKFDEKNSV